MEHSLCLDVSLKVYCDTKQQVGVYSDIRGHYKHMFFFLFRFLHLFLCTFYICVFADVS